MNSGFCLKVLETELTGWPLKTRIPFRYGITTMTGLPHAFLRLRLLVNGKAHDGWAADHLPPKWFTKNPQTLFADDIVEMKAVIAQACSLARESEPADNPFEFWLQLYERQMARAKIEGIPPLLAGFGVSLVERACIDAFCRAVDVPFARAVQENRFGIRPAAVHPELGEAQPRDLLPAQPLPSLIVRHTVGLGDPLTGHDIRAEERVDDGLPHALEDCIHRYGLTHFKIKLGGDPAVDGPRLARIARLLETLCGQGPAAYAFSLDGNENFESVAPFRQLWESLQNDPALTDFLSHLLFVEQPFHRKVALAAQTGAELRAWGDRPALIIDESDGELHSLPTALQCGYVGTSHKNCKGVFKSIANACLLVHRQRENPAGGPLILSAEDLSNVGPIALLQDLTVAATLGIGHVERNGHHYFAGLQQFPHEFQERTLSQHPDLYARHPAGFPTVRITGGKIAVNSLLTAPFGYGVRQSSGALGFPRPSKAPEDWRTP